MSAGEKLFVTPEAYLAAERRAETRSEYDSGFVRSMAGATYVHTLITSNINGELRSRLRGSPCRVSTNDLRVAVERTGLYAYPDVVVLCGEPDFLDDAFDTVRNPSVIFEVLSPSTEAYDRGRKFAHYQPAESLAEYILVAQDRVSVERYTRDGDHWTYQLLTDLDAVLTPDSIACTLPLREIYENVTVPPPGEVPPTPSDERHSSR